MLYCRATEGEVISRSLFTGQSLTAQSVSICECHNVVMSQPTLIVCSTCCVIKKYARTEYARVWQTIFVCCRQLPVESAAWIIICVCSRIWQTIVCAAGQAWQTVTDNYFCCRQMSANFLADNTLGRQTLSVAGNCLPDSAAESGSKVCDRHFGR